MELQPEQEVLSTQKQLKEAMRMGTMALEQLTYVVETTAPGSAIATGSTRCTERGERVEWKSMLLKACQESAVCRSWRHGSGFKFILGHCLRGTLVTPM